MKFAASRRAAEYLGGGVHRSLFFGTCALGDFVR